MYHYVRDLTNSRYPEIKGRDIEDFREQLNYIRNHYHVVDTEHVLASIRGDSDLPKNAAWLTFDDGYLDHFTYVFPLLELNRLHGAFFPVTSAATFEKILDVNKIHFILASEKDVNKIISLIRDYIDEHSGTDGILRFNGYWKSLSKSSRFDSTEIKFVKNLLQHGLPETHRAILADKLFQRFVTSDKKAFRRELYMSVDQLRLMVQSDMYVGSHGAGHYWMDSIDSTKQEEEIDMSLEFLGRIGAPVSDWVMCYPYGSYNDSLLSLLPRKGCAAGLTTQTAVANIETDTALLLPRLDTNDIPTSL